MIRVLVVEDSPSIRSTLVRYLDKDSEIRVVGQAANGRLATEMNAQLHPDLITMDVVMPDMDGLEATRCIMASHPTKILIVTAHGDSPELNVAFEAIQAGALDVIDKPHAADDSDSDWEQEFIGKVKALGALEIVFTQ